MKKSPNVIVVILVALCSVLYLLPTLVTAQQPPQSISMNATVQRRSGIGDIVYYYLRAPAKFQMVDPNGQQHFLYITSDDQAWVAISERTGENAFVGNIQNKSRNATTTSVYPLDINGVFRTDRIDHNNVTGVTVYHGDPNISSLSIGQRPASSSLVFSLI
jgi:hypothetical protein